MCEVQWQLDRLTDGPQRFAFCASQINTFNKVIGTKLEYKFMKKISQFTQFFNVQMLQMQSRQ